MSSSRDYDGEFLKQDEISAVAWTIHAATVVFVSRYFAILSAPGMPMTDKAYLHVSEYSAQHIDSLTEHIAVGYVLEIMLLFFNKERGSWESSVRGVALQRALVEQDSLCSSVRLKVKKISPSGIYLGNEDLYARISKEESAELIANGIGTYDSYLDAKLIRYDPVSRGYLATCGAIENVSEGSIISATISYLELDSSYKNHTESIVWIVHLRTSNGLILRSKLWKIALPQYRFHEGITVESRIIRRSTSKWFYWVDIVGPRDLKAGFDECLRPGEVRKVTIYTVVDYGAFFCISDGREEFIHRSSIIPDSIPALRSYLSPGDIVEVRVREPREKEREFGFDFLRIIERRDQSEASSGRSVLFDLEAIKVKGSVGGYYRSPRFKQEVVERFQHKCVFCGVVQSIRRIASAAEAAHIIPRSARGADSIRNALCLCRLHHWAFDWGLISISDEGTVIVSDEIGIDDGGISASLMSMCGAKIFWPNDMPLPIKALAWHRRNVLLGS